MSGRTQHANAAFLLRVQKGDAPFLFDCTKRSGKRKVQQRGGTQRRVPPLVQSPPRAALTFAPSRAAGGDDCAVLSKNDCSSAATL